MQERHHFVQLVRRFAGATTDAILDSSMQQFALPHIEGFIAYRPQGKTAIVFGDPTCSVINRPVLAKAFNEAMTSCGRSIVYISASPTFTEWALKNGHPTTIEFGKELILNPTQDPAKETGTYGSLVRRKTRAAVREGVVVTEHLPGQEDVRQAIEKVGEVWLSARKGMQLHISNIHLFEDTEGKRWFYAKQGERVIGVVCLNRLEQHGGWLLNHLMPLPDAPNGTSELLVISTLDVLRQEGCQFLTVGFVTLQELGKLTGIGPLSRWVTKMGFRLARTLVHLDGLSMFWKKFKPREVPSYLVFSRKGISLPEVLRIKKVLTGGHRDR